MSSNSNEGENQANESERRSTRMALRKNITDVLLAEIDSPGSRYLMQKVKDKASAGSSTRQSTKKRYINRQRETGSERLLNDYFVDKPVYTDAHFRRRFRMRKHLFLRIVNDLESRYTFFKTRYDCTGRKGFSSIDKCTAGLRMLAYGCPADMLDETLRMGESTIMECLREFTAGIREVYGETYLRRPDATDTARLLRIGEARGFPGSNNDINVLNQSPLFTDHLLDQNTPVQFQVNGRLYDLGYYLAYGIYPQWAAFVKTIPVPQTEKQKLFAQYQEGVRKDVERAFGVLQSRFAIVRGPVKIWDHETISDIMYACIILHNMIVEDERDDYNVRYDYEPMDGVDMPTMNDISPGATDWCEDSILQINADIHNRTVHQQLQQDLLEHIWQKFGGT